MSTTAERLIRSANQIASFFDTQPGGDPVSPTAQHMRDFWDPSMRRLMAELLASNDAQDLSPTALAAAQKITAQA